MRRHARLVDFRARRGGLGAHDRGPRRRSPRAAAAVTVAAGDVAVDAPGSATRVHARRRPHRTRRAGRDRRSTTGARRAAACPPARPSASSCARRPADPLGDGWLAAGDLLAVRGRRPRRPRRATTAGRTRTAAVAGTGRRRRPRFRDPLASRRAQVVELTRVEPFDDPLLGAALALFRVRWGRAGRARALLPGRHRHRRRRRRGHRRARRTSCPPTTAGSSTGRAGAPCAGARARRGAAGRVRAARRRRAGRTAAARRPGPGARRRRAARTASTSTSTLPSGLTVGGTWTRHAARRAAAGSDFAFVVDVEEHEPPVLRFATGAVGLAPPLGSVVARALRGRRRRGGQRRGQRAAPAGAQHGPGRRQPGLGGRPGGAGRRRSVRNPVTAGTGGADPMALDVARRDAPEAFAAPLAAPCCPPTTRPRPTPRARVAAARSRSARGPAPGR